MRRALVIAALCVSLSACVAIPNDGAVRANDADVGQASPLLPVLQGPEPDATPRAIAQGFIKAAAGGSVSGFDTAREFLTSTASAGWDPLAEVTIFDSRAVALTFDEASGVFTYRVPVAGQLDASGVLVEAPPDATRDLTFTVSTDEQGRYRVSGLEDGIDMSAADFARFYRPVPLYFASADGTTMVPELRWFPASDQIATTAVARELVEGPSLWLADAVETGFPPGATLAVDAVVVADGTATVALAPGSAGTPAQRSLAGEQLRLTLTSLPNVQSVVTTVGDLPLDGDDSASLNEAPLPSERAAVIADGRLGYWDGSQVAVTPLDAGVVPAGASGLALAYDLSRVAMVLGGDVVTSTALADAAALEPQSGPLEQTDLPEIPTALAIDGEALVAPSYDSYGWLWSTESLSGGVILAAGDDGTVSELGAPQLSGRPVQAIAVSRDGTRLAVLSRANGGQVLEVMAIVRDANGRPISLGVPLALYPSATAASGLAWVDSVSVAVLAEESGEVALVTVGGWTEVSVPVPGATGLSARNGARTLLVVDVEGTLAAGSGSSWTPLASGVRDVAFAG